MSVENSGQSYSWLDVLCLRQVGEERDDEKRLEEWKTDVPTIGGIYGLPSFRSALVYFNGLGRPFRNGGYDDPRHWFNRAWTVQEAVLGPMLGGATPSSPTLKTPPQLEPGQEFEEFYTHFASAFVLEGDQVFIFSSYIAMMRKRHAITELDRISGLASVSRPRRLPIYDPKQSSEDAWEILIKVNQSRSRAHLFLWYPVTGHARYSCFPSWSQVMMPDVPAADSMIEGHSTISYDKARKEFHGEKFRIIDDCSVIGLDSPSLETSSWSSVFRTGSIDLGSQQTKTPQKYSVVARHQVIIGTNVCYTFIFPDLSPDVGFDYGESRRFVVGVKNDAGEFQKLCVLDIVSEEDISEVNSFGSVEGVVLI